MRIITNETGLGGIGTQNYTDEQKTMMASIGMTIEVANSSMAQGADDLYRFLKARTKTIERKDGQEIPIKYSNVLFTRGGLASRAIGFSTYTDKFTMQKGTPLHIEIFNRTMQDVMDADNAGIDLAQIDLAGLDNVAKLYVNNYLPNIATLPAITGSSMSPSIPAMSTGSDEYGRSFGWIRGDDVSDLMPSTQGITTADHYRGLIGNTLTLEDITSLTDLLESYSGFSRSKNGVVAIVHPRVLANLGNLYQNLSSRDSMIIDGVVATNFLGIKWLECAQMSKEFILFLDGGEKNLFLECVNPSKQQRGFALVDETDSSTFDYKTGLKGMKAVIFEQEFITTSRHKGAILDIVRKGKTSTTSDGACGMSDAGVVALELFAKRLEKSYREMDI